MDKGTIGIFSVDASPSISDRSPMRSFNDASSHASSIGKQAIKKVAVETLRENMIGFLNGLDAIIKPEDRENENDKKYVIDTIELEIQIDGKGNIGLKGIASAELGLQGGMKLILRRK